MIDYKLYGTLSGSVDDVMHTVGSWANQRFKDVCDELDEANRTIQELKDELESKITSNNASATTVEQYEYEELVAKFINTVPSQRYHDMLNDYFDLVGKIKNGTALEYIKGLK